MAKAEPIRAEFERGSRGMAGVLAGLETAEASATCNYKIEYEN